MIAIATEAAQRRDHTRVATFSTSSGYGLRAEHRRFFDFLNKNKILPFLFFCDTFTLKRT